jgi:hypothetical protein
MSQEQDVTTTAKAGEEQAKPEQEQIDRIVKERLDRERKKFEREKSELLKQFDGIDPEEYRKLKQDIEERENKKLEEQGKFEEIRKKLSSEKEQLRAEYEKRLQEKDENLRRLVLGDKVRNAALQAGVFPEDIEDVLLLTSKHFALDDDGTVRVLDDNGREVSESLGDFFSKTFRERKPKFFKGANATGAGVTGGSAHTGQDWHKLSPVERLNAARQSGKK